MTNQWLDFSALYISPPLMTTEHKTFTITQDVTSGTIQQWYPHASVRMDGRSITWNDVQVGVMADGLATTHPVWMTPRAVESAATLKVYTSGRTPAVPVEHDDPGTTEGDVYLFLRAVPGARVPLALVEGQTAGEYLVRPEGSVVASENTAHAWLVKRDGEDEVLLRRLQLNSSNGELTETRTPASFESTEKTDIMAFKAQLNEALAGNGLRPDEATALSGLVVESVQRMTTPGVIYLVPQIWVDANIPLKIDGPAEKPLRTFVGIAAPAPALPKVSAGQ